MAKETFRSLIAANCRNSTILMIVMVVLFVVAGAVFGEALLGDFAAGVIAGSVIAAILLAFAWSGGSSAIMAVSGAHEVRKSDLPRLFNVIEELSLASGVPMPKVYLIDSDSPNAFATGNSPENAAVAITSGLYSKLTRDELQGVMAHEMAHVRNYDIRYSMLMAVLAGGLVMLSEIFLRASFFAGSSRRRDKDNGQVLFVLIGIVLAILAPLLTSLIQLAMSRQREYLADATAVEFTRNPDGLADALEKLARDTTPLEYSKSTESMYIVSPALNLRGGADNLFSTHPPIEERIKRLRNLK